ncbi:protein NRT1/ PTR FAMILY 6.2-like [Quillaja saponaria]|uniref:Protein NRT1/ PTR FAMILY 6.2-like n=1 Tax=Quillaja saponaria TaxID=32244 RepID=A0AAD7PIQ7_QUISA|nr:protein NRT1/ PTR FAMILY 6.2-like [Quillaja saponaria]
MGIFYTAPCSLAIGAEGIKSSVSGLGPDQFDQKDEKEKAQMTHFFNMFYFITSYGTLLAVTVFVYVQDKVGRGLAYGISSGFMFVAIPVFLFGTKRYRYKECKGSPVVQVLQVFVAAIRKRKAEFPYDTRLLYDHSPEPGEARIYHKDKLRCLDKAAILTKEDFENNRFSNPNPWRLCNVTKVEEVKMLSGLMPVWSTTILHLTIHSQLSGFTIQQATTMDASIGNFQIPSASFYTFFTGSIMVTLAIYDHLILPLLKKHKMSEKTGLGLFFAILGMAAAAQVERRRLSVVRAQRGSNTLTLPVSAFMLLPQFILVGIAEAFMYSGQLDFFTRESPNGMKAIGTDLFF